jgi:hypothetical protein
MHNSSENAKKKHCGFEFQPVSASTCQHGKRCHTDASKILKDCFRFSSNSRIAATFPHLGKPKPAETLLKARKQIIPKTNLFWLDFLDFKFRPVPIAVVWRGPHSDKSLHFAPLSVLMAVVD